MPTLENDGKPRPVGVIIWVLLILGLYSLLPSLVLSIVVQIDMVTNTNLEVGQNWFEEFKAFNRHYFPLILAFSSVAQFLFFAFLPIVFYPKFHGRSVVHSFSLRLGSIWGPLLGFFAGLTLVPLASWLGEFWFWLFPSLRKLVELFGYEGNITSDPKMIGFYVFAIGMTPAICEEILFRGYLQGTLQRVWKPHTAILFSSIFFALIHQNAFGITTLLLVGLYLGWLFYRFQSLAATAAFHFAYNTTIVLVGMTDFFPGIWDELGNFNVWVTVGATVVWIVISIAIYHLTQKQREET